MMSTKEKCNSMRVMAGVLVLSAIIGNVAIVNIRIAGMVPTYYRVIVPVLFIICIICSIRAGTMLIIGTKRGLDVNRIFFVMGAIWVLYGLVSVFISPWSNTTEGIKELFGIILGLMSIYVLIILCMYDQFESIIVMLKIVLMAILIIGYVEVFSGWHMPTSMFSDTTYLTQLQTLYPNIDIAVFTHQVSTGIFYNPNDYCAFLTIFAPILIYYRDDISMLTKVLHFVGIGALFMMLLIDDSFICIVAFFVGIVFYFIVSKASLKKWMSLIVTCAVVRICGTSIVNMIFQLSSGNILIQTSNLNTMITSQIMTMNSGSGSLLYRINTYIYAITEMFDESKGIGLGAGSFSNYFASMSNDLKMMSNPHSLWVEILSQYGLIVFAIVIATFIYVFIKLYQSLKKTGDNKYVLAMSMGICFIFASFAPSKFLAGSYYWMIFGLALGIISRDQVCILPNENIGEAIIK